MKRDIKYKVWHKKNRQMYQVTTIHFGHDRLPLGVDCYDGEFEFGFGVNEIELLEYTGLKDKNGVEIYEGDILTNEAISHAVEKKEMDYWIVEYDRGCFGCRGMALRALKGIEVIGNIHGQQDAI